MAISSEFTSGMIRTTFAATPRRHTCSPPRPQSIGGQRARRRADRVRDLATSSACSLLRGNGYAAANGYAGVETADAVRGVAGTAVYYAALALFSLGIGAILRNTAAAISTVLALLWLPLILVSTWCRWTSA